MVIKEFQHPTNDQKIFSNLPKLESVYLKYGKPAKMKEEISLDVMSNSFKSFLKNAETRLSALENTGNAEIRINCDPSACPANLGRTTMSLGRVLQAFGDFLAERKESLRGLQLAPFEAYYKQKARVKSLFQLDLETLKFPDNSYRLSKLRVAYQRESPENTTRSGQYNSVLKAVVEHLDTLYIKWGEENRLDLHQVKLPNAFLYPLLPIWANRTKAKCTPIQLRALAIDFNWVNVSFADEDLHRRWFKQSWEYTGEKLGLSLDGDRFKKLSLTLPYNPEAQEQGCFYFSEAFIQAFVQNRSLDYLRLVCKAWPGVALKFGPVELVTLEISFACFKGEIFSQELVQAAKNGSGDPTKRGILFDLECDYWKKSHFAGSVRSLKLKNAPYFDKDLATHLATAFPYLAMFSFTAFNRQVYNQGDFLPGLIRLLERIYSLRVIKLEDSFDKGRLDLLPLLRDLHARAQYDTGRFVFYARKATLDERSQTILDNSKRVRSNFRITVETYPHIQVQEGMHREFSPALQSPFPNEGLQSSPSLPVNLPEYPNVDIYQPTPPQQFLPIPNPTVASSRAPSPVGLPQAARNFSGLADHPLTPSGSISPQTFNVQPTANVPGHQAAYQFQGSIQQQTQFPNERLQNAHLHLSPNAPDRTFQQQTQPPIQRGPAVVSRFAPQNQQSNVSGFYNCPQSVQGNPNMTSSGSYSPHTNLNMPQNMHPAANVSGNQPAYSFLAHQAANQPQLQNPPMHGSQNWPPNVGLAANFSGNQANYQFPENVQSQPQTLNHGLQSRRSAPLHLFQNAPNLTYQQTLPQLVSLPPNPTVATSRSPLSGGLLHDELDFSYFNDLPQNVQPAANIPGNQVASPFPVQQAANQGQPSPHPAAESTAEIDEFTRMLAEQFNKDPNK